MIAIAKVDSSEKFRKDMYKSKRKSLSEVWKGNDYLDIANIVKFAPSSCNTQPWITEVADNKLKVYRYKKKGKRGTEKTLNAIYNLRGRYRYGII